MTGKESHRGHGEHGGDPGAGEWSPLLKTGDLRISLYTDETLEIRDGQTIYAHLTAAETADFLRWIDARDKHPNPADLTIAEEVITAKSKLLFGPVEEAKQP